jgi:phosphopantothenoylcysteine decarboxylase / phosphopantothenate---cysteine ligase
MSLENKKILLGVSGSIAAYKSAWLVRLLVKAGAEVQVILTDTAKDFVTPLTLSTLSKKPVFSSFTSSDEGTWHNHVDLGLWADLMLIAPATAHTLAKCAHGICDSLLIATYLSARCPVYFAPAMDLDMYAHFSTEDSLKRLIQNGNFIIEPADGELASGLSGKGRMVEPEEIMQKIEAHWYKDDFFVGKKVLITAGPSQEDIDPVRYISNHSSGKMGFELAELLNKKGAKVILVSGPTALKASYEIQVIKVRSALDFYTAVDQHYAEHDVLIFSAAIADYKPTEIATQKLKKKENEMSIQLSKTVDIASEMGKRKSPRKIHVGFALETNNELEHATGKLERKNFDMVVLNSLNDPGAGFQHDTNKISILTRNNEKLDFSLKSKKEVALDIVETLKNYMLSHH